MANSTVAFGALETAESLDDRGIDTRAREILAALRPDEKMALMSGDAPFWSGLAEMVSPGGLSSRPWVAGAVPRLGIPGIRFLDGPRGAIMPGGTTFPVSMARGATWDIELEERVGDAIGREVRAFGANLFGGVCINLLRHPAWGRSQETYGEDPCHVGAFGSALVRGVQRHVMACAKHFALNSMENARFRVDVTVDPRALHEVYLPHFRRVVAEGAAAVMSAYNSVNGSWCGQNPALLSVILKGEWGFRGFVLTDFIMGMRDARAAALAGQDLEMPFRWHFSGHLSRLVERGEVPMERVDDAALRLLRQQVRFGQGRDPREYGAEVVGSAKHRALAREVAAKSIVLLKNEGRALPLPSVGRIAVIGRLADTPNTGDAGSSNTNPAYVVTPLQGLRTALGVSGEIRFDPGNDAAQAAAAARGCDAAVVVVGYTAADEGEYLDPATMAEFGSTFPAPMPEEAPIVAALTAPQPSTDTVALRGGGDLLRLELRPSDEALILAVAAACPRTAVVIMAGGAVITEAWRHKVPAIAMLWYPGMEGGHALADVLLGRINPSGRLPCSFPVAASDLPHFDREARSMTYDLWHGYRKLDRDGATPAFPFGFGLSYTTFSHGDLRVERDVLGADGALEARVSVTNTGSVAGEEVVQLYVSAAGSKVDRPPRELKAFARVALVPGEKKVVRLAVPVSDLAYYDEGRGWVVEPLRYEAIVGRSSRDEAALRAGFWVTR